MFYQSKHPQRGSGSRWPPLPGMPIAVNCQCQPPNLSLNRRRRAASKPPGTGSPESGYTSLKSFSKRSSSPATSSSLSQSFSFSRSR